MSSNTEPHPTSASSASLDATLTLASMATLQAPVCQLGYPQTQLQTMLSPERYEQFMHWMRGQTMAICNGRRYNYDTNEYEATGCGPHDGVVYSSDFKRWLAHNPA